MKYSDRKSHSPNKTVPLSRQEFDQIRDYILQKTGIYFQDNKLYLLQSRLMPRLGELGLYSYEDYYSLLTASGHPEEFQKMVSAITINETYFFRSSAQFNLIESSILPQLIKQKQEQNAANPKIRLWSAACSAGDEPYTLSIILQHNFLHRYPNIQFEVLASDIDPVILARAKQGIYNAYSIRNIPPPLLKKYFIQRGDQFQIKQEIAERVEFRRINLADRIEMMSMHNIDLAICANVLIYFPTKIRQQVVSSIYNSLSPQGFFMVGFSETLFGIDHKFTQVRNGKSMTYQKGHSSHT